MMAINIVEDTIGTINTIFDTTTFFSIFDVTTFSSIIHNEDEKYEIFDWELPFRYDENKTEVESWSVIKEYYMPILFISESGNLLLLLEEGPEGKDKWLLIKTPKFLSIKLLRGEISIQDLIQEPLTSVYLVCWNIKKDYIDVVEQVDKEYLKLLTDGINLSTKLRKNSKIERILKYFTDSINRIRVFSKITNNLKYNLTPSSSYTVFSYDAFVPTPLDDTMGGLAA